MAHRIQPIETVYAGHKFRSRLEARWAVFLDTLGIRYEYEPEGYTREPGGTGPGGQPARPERLPKRFAEERLDLQGKTLERSEVVD